MGHKFELSIDEYLQENPEIQKILTMFGETMQTYQDTLVVMGQSSPAQVLTGNTSSVNLQETSLSTSTVAFKFKSA